MSLPQPTTGNERDPQMPLSNAKVQTAQNPSQLYPSTHPRRLPDNTVGGPGLWPLGSQVSACAKGALLPFQELKVNSNSMQLTPYHLVQRCSSCYVSVQDHYFTVNEQDMVAHACKPSTGGRCRIPSLRRSPLKHTHMGPSRWFSR